MTRRQAAIGLVALAVLAALLYLAIRQTRDLTDFEVFRTAGTRLLHAEPLYRAEDGHFVFKYLPASPLAVPLRSPAGTREGGWFVVSFALVAVIAGSIRARS